MPVLATVTVCWPKSPGMTTPGVNTAVGVTPRMIVPVVQVGAGRVGVREHRQGHGAGTEHGERGAEDDGQHRTPTLGGTGNDLAVESVVVHWCGHSR